jgi:predicted membrane protein
LSVGAEVNPLVAAFLLPNAVALFFVPRRWAPLPLILCACYITRVGVDLGPFTFTPLRILVCVGLLRVLAKREEVGGGIQSIDRWMMVWGAWLVASVFFHNHPAEQLVTRLGLVLDSWGLYFLFRVFCHSRDEFVGIFRLIAILLAPLAMAMLIEKASAHNVFAVFGGVPEAPIIRASQVRAQGPFGVSILAGTVGAVCVPLLIGLWRIHRTSALIGLTAAVGIIYASTSSGPILTAMWGVAGLLVWGCRYQMRWIRWAAVVAYLTLNAAMNDPAYFLMARIDLTGSSTGWHRAELIRSAFSHFSEWWFAGTDYTRHWMPYGIQWSADHSDITNHYLSMGVLGGLPLILAFVMVLVKAFSMLGEGLRDHAGESPQRQFLVWALGASLFAHTITFLSVTYYDQSVLFLYLTLAGAGAMRLRAVVATARERNAVTPAFGTVRLAQTRARTQPKGWRHPAGLGGPYSLRRGTHGQRDVRRARIGDLVRPPARRP